MRVQTRNGGLEEVDFNKILDKLNCIAKMNNLTHVEPDIIAKKTVAHIIDGISTSALDDYSAVIAADEATTHPEYLKFAGNILISSLHKETNPSCYQTWKSLSNLKDANGNVYSLLSEEFLNTIDKFSSQIDNIIDHKRDYELLDFFGVKTLIRSYLLKDNKVVKERPQYMFLRVAIVVNMGSDFCFDKVVESYNLFSKGYYTHATPTLFNAGTKNQQMASCFLLKMKDDSIDGIFDTIHDCAKISKFAGGIGISVHEIRGKGSLIRGTNGVSNGLRPMLQVFNQTARYVDQGGGKRNGSIAVYLEPWHCDIKDFLELKVNGGDENNKARDLFLALWVPDLFLERVEKGLEWSLMSPDECPGLNKVYGKEFNQLYEKYEAEGKYREKIKAIDLMKRINEVQIETGVPYMLFKDASNKKSNQKNVGVIESSNLCAEIIEVSSPTETAVCNLASINLTKFVVENYFDFTALEKVAYTAVTNLDRVIDNNKYPCKEAEFSNEKNRPVGLGIQGLADVFFLLKISFGSKEASLINKKIFETIYYGAVAASADRAEKYGSYSTFEGSPFSQGQLQFDLWGVKPDDSVGALSIEELNIRKKFPYLPTFDWDSLKLKVKKGMRNSLLTALMPTASTASILGNYECFEPQISNIYVRSTSAGSFTVINKYLVNDLCKLNLWNVKMKDQIIRDDGSIQKIAEIPENIKNIYKTAWEIGPGHIIDLSADRGIYIDQSQSLNIFIEKPDRRKLKQCHLHAWKRGLKTGMYYLRSRPAAMAMKPSLGTQFIENKQPQEQTECEMCSA